MADNSYLLCEASWATQAALGIFSLNNWEGWCSAALANAEEVRSHAKNQEQFMKLNKVQIGRTLSQFPAQVLAEDHPAAMQFCELFGDHTFFLDARGLSVLEALEVPGMEAQDGEIIRLADWSDANFTKLTTYQPEPTGLIIRLKEVQH
jgi:hypothetical protein